MQYAVIEKKIHKHIIKIKLNKSTNVYKYMSCDNMRKTFTIQNTNKLASIVSESNRWRQLRE